MKYFLSLSILLTSIGIAGENSKDYVVLEDKARIQILNPTLAERKTAKLRLANGLEIYLISDPTTPQSGAALAVEAGCWQDPKEYPGMAHFCEHMLFMGTTTYPNEFEYMQYVIDHGGTVNASTWPDHTIYMFSINNDSFAGALDRLSHFFIDPLFSRNCIDRELHAVDQEHAKNIENDMWRSEMIFKETGNSEHPNVLFSTGNAETLRGIPEKALREWYEQHYSSNLMHLVVISPLPLNELIPLVAADFSRVPNRKVEAPVINVKMTSSRQLGHRIYINPIKDLKQLSLIWELPQAYANDNDHHVVSLITYVLENESDKSLIQQLKREKLAENIRIDADRFSKNHSLFQINIDLTQQGINQIDQVIERVFQTLSLLRETGIPSSTYEEYVKISRLHYQYQSRPQTFEYIYQVGNGLLYENLETYPEKSIIPSTYNADFINGLLSDLSPFNCTILVTADPELTGEIPDTLEKWMNAEYTVRAIPQEKLSAWNNIAPHSKISLPPANPYLPGDNLSLLESDKKSSQEPILITNDEKSKIYYLKDNHYLIPEVGMIFGLRSPLIDGSAKRKALLDLYNKALQDKLSSTLSFAESAGLHVNFEQQDLKFNISIFGFNEKAPVLTKEIFRTLKTIAPSAEQFDLYKESIQSAYDNQEKELPVIQAIFMMMSMITNDAPTARDLQKALKGTTYEEFLAFSQQLFKQAYIEGMLYGNLLEAEARAQVNEIKSVFATNVYSSKQHVKKSVLSLPEKSGPFMVVQNTERQGNAVLLLIEEGPFSFEKRASQQVLGKALQNSFFETLRTKQQTAYWAKAWDTEMQGQMLQFFSVQSSTHHPSDLISRFELFLEDFTKNFSERMSKERFETIRSQQAAFLRLPLENLARMTLRLNTLAFDYNGDFHWIEKRIAALESLTYEQIAKDAQKFLSRDNQKRLAILLEGVLSSDNDFRYEQVTKEEICDLGTYISWR